MLGQLQNRHLLPSRHGIHGIRQIQTQDIYVNSMVVTKNILL